MTAPRPASESPFPYASRRVCYFHLETGVPEQVKSTKADLWAAVNEGIELFAVWPGEYRSDLFVIDKPSLLLAAVSPKVRAQ